MNKFEPNSPLVSELAGNIYQFNRLSTKPELPDELRHQQFHFLIMLSKLIQPGAKGIKASVMSDALHITRGGITHILNDLEDAGFIERFSDPNDRRLVLIRPTELGTKTMDESYQRYLLKLEGLTNYLGEEDTREFIRILTNSITYLLKVREKDAASCEEFNGEIL